MRRVGGSLFAAQLGGVIGRLSQEVVSGGDVGIPVMPDGVAAILPQNFADFGRDLDVTDDQLALYLANPRARARSPVPPRPMAAAARDHPGDRVRPRHPRRHHRPRRPRVALRPVLTGGAALRPRVGALLPQRTPAQDAALVRLENLLATIEGWVDVVTADATSRLPAAAKIAEAVRRRRAVGGPAEQAMASLVGLELRPRRLREAAAMWRAVTDAVGIEARDRLWDYPDLMPGASDIDDPQALVARLVAHERGEDPERDALDEALDALLAEAAEEAEHATGDPGAQASDDDGPEDPRPV
jgi:hypothetical protein